MTYQEAKAMLTQYLEESKSEGEWEDLLCTLLRAVDDCLEMGLQGEEVALGEVNLLTIHQVLGASP